MLKTQSISPVVRAILVVGAVAALVTGVTFAALDSEATLTDNRLASATAGLQVDNTDDDTNPGGATDVGFEFAGLVPGAEFLNPGHNFKLTNDGDADLRVKVKVSGAVSTGTIDKTKVHFQFENLTNTGASANPIVYTLAELETAGQWLPGVQDPDSLAVSQDHDFNVKVRLDADAITGSSASIDDFVFTFTGSSFAPAP